MGKVDGESIIGSALALIASFAWRDAITEAIDTYYPVNVGNSKNLQVKFTYAIAVTMFVFLAFYLYVEAVYIASAVSPSIDNYMDENHSRLKLLPTIEGLNESKEHIRGHPHIMFST